MKAAGSAQSAAIDAGVISAGLLEALRRAGPDGAKPASLRLSGKSPAAPARREAFAALIAAGSAAILGTGAAARYFLAEHLPTAQTVSTRLVALGSLAPDVSTTPLTLWKPADFARKLPAHERPLLGAALAHLQAEKVIVPLRHGRNAYWAFAGPWRVGLDVEAARLAGPIASATNDEELFTAYARLVRESGGFPDVKIAGLRRALPGVPVADRLIALWREGRATFGLGDWSLADEPTRAAAVEFDGEKYLLVRLGE